MKIRVLLILLLFFSLISANPTENKKLFSNSILGGYNYTFLTNYENSPRIGYSLSLLSQNKVADRISIFYLFSFSRNSTFIKDLSSLSIGMNAAYKNYYDLEFEAYSIDLSVLGNYKIYDTNNLKFSFGLGLGFLLTIEDKSKKKNIRVTDEVVYTYDTPPVDEYDAELTYLEENSGFIACSNLTVCYKRLNLTFFYKYTFFNLKDLIYNDRDIGKMNTLSLLIGFRLS